MEILLANSAGSLLDIDPKVLTFLMLLFNGVIALLLYVWKGTIRDLKADISDIKKINDTRHVEFQKFTTDILRDVHELDKRVLKVETESKVRTQSLETIDKKLDAFIKEIRTKFDNYDHNIQQFFQDYDLKKKE